MVDVLGVGFGPANLALAIALAESPGRIGSVRFLERRESFAWHPGMLLPGTSMQISFLKDLVTLRNQASPFSFVAYLGARGRLVDFVNRGVLTPERAEFADYLAWAATPFADQVRYGRTVTGLRRCSDGPRFAVTHRGAGGDEQVTRARSVIVAPGLRPVLPAWATGLDPRRVFHNIDLVPRLGALERDLPSGVADARFLVVGGGQSAAEVALHLHDTGARVDLVFHGFGMADVDESPFVNQVFDPDVVDEFATATPEVRDALLHRHGNTNYAAVEHGLTRELYDRWYRQKVIGSGRLGVHRTSDVVSAAVAAGGGVETIVRRLTTGETTAMTVDAVVCATGFHPGGLTGFEGVAPPDADVHIARSHRAVIDGAEVPGLFVQGADLPGHGLGTTLLSNVAVRAGEIARALEHEESP
ncbi:lysine N(6)-hydroxylase/L-ornithine N(5)-oxygenase family protein [Tsukamurella asaccharolytica]|uniref:L-lysine N6-monooxygenase MbtG n=1 Tax=Tsukamurella asaccharolytica TaxID=2592067 RepID=A0A5C5RDN7_9ACTN|nr:SidA/IucD/PvdA family monooxygenase [Tsukamurella asaccharolytica]TWS20221.1 lysine N(6)-hydroxylase/L-ornithine N(5)-oxygenase family protein [Tsukamurella asaccharolytica]